MCRNAASVKDREPVMGRIFALVILACGGYVLFSHHLWDFVRPQDQILWAALLPAAYILGMALLRD